MARALLLLLLACARLGPRPARCQEAPQTPDWRMTLKTIRNGVHKIDVYLNAALDLLGGEDGLCQYKCSDGEEAGGGGRLAARPRPRRPGATLVPVPPPRLASGGAARSGLRGLAEGGSAPRETGRSLRGNLRIKLLHTCVCLC